MPEKNKERQTVRENQNKFKTYLMMDATAWKEVDPLLGNTSDQEINRRTNISVKALAMRRKNLGIAAWKKPAVDKDLFIKLAAEGLTYEEISARIGFSVGSLYHFAADHKINVKKAKRKFTPAGMAGSPDLEKVMLEAKWRGNLIKNWLVSDEFKHDFLTPAARRFRWAQKSLYS